MSKRGDGKYGVRGEIREYENWPLDRKFRSLNVGSFIYNFNCLTELGKLRYQIMFFTKSCYELKCCPLTRT